MAVGVTIRMVSLDTAVHPDLGNLANGENYDHVRRLAQGGHLAGVLAGPPCETWSAARHILLDDGAGPRPLRSARSPMEPARMHRAGIEAELYGHTTVDEHLDH